jgi:hypothetical protein
MNQIARESNWKPQLDIDGNNWFLRLKSASSSSVVLTMLLYWPEYCYTGQHFAILVSILHYLSSYYYIALLVRILLYWSEYCYTGQNIAIPVRILLYWSEYCYTSI